MVTARPRWLAVVAAAATVVVVVAGVAVAVKVKTIGEDGRLGTGRDG